MQHKFEFGRRYRLEILPAGARSKTVSREMNFLGPSGLEDDAFLFDARPEAGTQTVHLEQIKASVDIGPAIWDRR